MNIFDILRETLGNELPYFKTRAIEIVNQVERLFNDTLKLNIGHKKLSADELAEHLWLHMELITFNPSTGEELKPCQMNELNRDLYTTMYHAKELMKKQKEIFIKKAYLLRKYNLGGAI